VIGECGQTICMKIQEVANALFTFYFVSMLGCVNYHSSLLGSKDVPVRFLSGKE
jgi:hypothetical protein